MRLARRRKTHPSTRTGFESLEPRAMLAGLGPDSVSGFGLTTAVLLPGVSSPAGIVLTGGSPTPGSASGTGGSQSTGPVLLGGPGSGTGSSTSGANNSPATTGTLAIQSNTTGVVISAGAPSAPGSTGGAALENGPPAQSGAGSVSPPASAGVPAGVDSTPVGPAPNPQEGGSHDPQSGIAPSTETEGTTPSSDEVPPVVGTRPILDNLPRDSTERHQLAQILVELNMRSLLFPGGANVCHRWTEAARNIIVAHGTEWHDNPHYTIEYIEWRFTPNGGWTEHGGLRVSFANGNVAYLDDGELSGFIVSYPRDVPADWTEGHIQSLAKEKGMPAYATLYDLSVLWNLFW